MKNKDAIFQIRNLRMWFPIKKGMLKKTVGNVKAVDDVSLDVYRGIRLWKIHLRQDDHDAQQTHGWAGVVQLRRRI